MAKRVVHISDVEAANDFAAVLARVQAGADVVIEHDATPVAIVRPAGPAHRTIDECIALLSPDSPAVVDTDFADDVAAVIASHPEPLSPA